MEQTSKFRVLPWLTLAAAAIVTTLACIVKEPIGYSENHQNAFYLTIAAMVGCVVFFAAARFVPIRFPGFGSSSKKHAVAMTVVYSLLTCITIVAAFNYFRFNKTAFVEVDHYMDSVYYYTNSKYYEELGHHDLYTAILVADQEGANRLRNIKRIRDLRTEKFISRNEALSSENVERIKAQFTPERWDAFKHDVGFFTQRWHDWSYLMIDRGYNPPATWTTIGGFLSNRVPVENLKILASIDMVLMLAAFVFIARAFGMHTLLFALLWYFVTFSGKWPVLGQAFLRFDWIAALVIGVCLLKMQRPAWAGGLFMFSVLCRVFPAVFVFPYVIYLVLDTIREKKLRQFHRHFIAGAVVVFVVQVGLTVIAIGPNSLVETVESLKIHSKSFSAHRNGLGVMLGYQGEKSEADLNANGGLPVKREAFNASKPKLYVATFIGLLILTIYLYARRPPLHDAVYLGVIPLFCVAILQSNYYNFRLLPVMAHASGIGSVKNKVLLLSLFVVEAVTQYVMTLGVHRYVVTSANSHAFAGYLLILIFFLVYETIAGGKKNQVDVPSAQDEKA